MQPADIIDIHPHVISNDLQKYPRAPLGGKASTWSESRPVTWQQLLEQMDKAGIAKAAIVQASTCYGFDNAYVAEAVANCPDRFTGVFSVDMLAKDAPEKIKYWVDQGLTGLRLFTAGSTMPEQSDVLGDPRSYPAWQAARDLGLSVCVQMRPQGLGMLLELIERFPTVRIILDHLMSASVESGPPYADAKPLFDLASHSNIFLKLTIVSVRRAHTGLSTPESFFKKVVESFGAHRIAWGSNFPTSEGSMLEILRESEEALSFLSERQRECIFSHTARSLYPSLLNR